MLGSYRNAFSFCLKTGKIFLKVFLLFTFVFLFVCLYGGGIHEHQINQRGNTKQPGLK